MHTLPQTGQQAEGGEENSSHKGLLLMCLQGNQSLMSQKLLVVESSEKCSSLGRKQIEEKKTQGKEEQEKIIKERKKVWISNLTVRQRKAIYALEQSIESSPNCSRRIQITEIISFSYRMFLDFEFHSRFFSFTGFQKN